MTDRRCTKCQTYYPNTPEYFSRNKKGNDLSLKTKCKKCEKKDHQIWRRLNPEKSRERCNNYYHKDVERSRRQSVERARRWREKHHK